MPLKFIRAHTNRTLWNECVDRFLSGLGDGRGPGDHAAYLWLTHRIQRDALFAEAAARGLPGWLNPPLAFFSDLPELFEIRTPSVGRLRRHALIAELARKHGGVCGISAELPERSGVVAALDALFGELLPEGVSAERLEKALDRTAADEFAECRNAWLVAVYGDYLEALGESYDPRQIHALVADRILAGELPKALGGARSLHVYGLHSLRTRRALIEALKSQTDVQVSLYALAPAPGDEDGDDFVAEEEFIDGDATPTARVQPAPDARRELEWVACEIKRLLLEEKAQPHTIAVVARTGREDVRRAHEMLTVAGIPNTARVRMRLAEVPALKAIVQLFRGMATEWSYRPLRSVLESAYFDLDIELMPIDYLASERRVETLTGWCGALCNLRDQAKRQEDDAREEANGWAKLNRKGIYSDRVDATYEKLEEFRTAVARYGQARSLDGWIDETKKLLDPGLFEFRANICRDDGCDYEIVRLDQQGVEALTRLLGEWSKAEDAEEIDAKEWYARLKRFLESNEIALSTPYRTGVRIVEAHEAALFPFEHTFVVHANDGEFPKRAGVEPLFSDEERRVFHARGLPLAHRESTLRRERALWRAVTANLDVAISYRTADVRGTPLLPSLLVPEHKEANAIARTRFLPDRPLNLAGSQQAAAHELAEAKRKGDSIIVAAPDPLAFKRSVLNAYAETRRRGGPGREAGVLGPWNGELRDPVLIDHLKERFGPDHLWSATSLELYGKCPFLFLVEKVLFLEVRDEADPETSPLVRGGVAHDILERFYGRLKATGIFPAALDAKTKALLHEIAEEVFAEREASRELLGGYLGDRHFWEIAKRSLLEQLEWYVGQELERHITANNERPEGFEVKFGYPGAPQVEVGGLDVTDTQRSMQVIGRIDRVDIKTEKKDGSESYWILDYKLSSKPAFKGYDDGSVIQVPLYMRALETLIANGDIELEARPVRGGRYRSLRRGTSLGNSAVINLNKKNCVEKYEKALRSALSIPERVRQGRFECKRANGAGDWPAYEPGLDVRRTDAQYEEGGGGRFDE